MTIDGAREERAQAFVASYCASEKLQRESQLALVIKITRLMLWRYGHHATMLVFEPFALNLPSLYSFVAPRDFYLVHASRGIGAGS